jgi:ferrochelatase
VQIVCPGFSADCLETIEEIGEENRDYFLEAGGERYEYIDALNSDESHIQAIHKLVNSHLQGWAISQTNTELRSELAKSMEAKY